MDFAYSLTLLISLAAGGLAATACLLAWRPVLGSRDSRFWRAWAQRASKAAWIALLASIGVHIAFGHRPGTPQALAPLAFLSEHRAFAWSGLLAAATLWVSSRRAS